MESLFYTNDPVINDGVEPILLDLFKKVVKFAHSTIFEVQPRSVENSLIFDAQEQPRISIHKLYLGYSVKYKTDRQEDSELRIYYFKAKDQYVEVAMQHKYSTNDRMICGLHPGHGREMWTSFVINDPVDFFYLFKRWLYFDHHNLWSICLQRFRRIVDEYYIQKHKSQYFLEIVRQARKNQKIHEVFRNEDLTNQISRAGSVKRAWPSPS